MEVDISSLTPGEETIVAELVGRVFDEFVAPEYGEEGRHTFATYIEPHRIRSDYDKGGILLVAKHAGHIIGILEMRYRAHISLLFVDAPYHRQGIAGKLWQVAQQISLSNDPTITEFTVNSSTYAVPIYEKLGFVEKTRQVTRNGMTFVPMKLKC